MRKSILLTGGSGELGKRIRASSRLSGHDLYAPAREELDITRPETITAYLESNPIDAVIHCAALARMKACEQDPAAAVNVNVAGTANLVAETLRREKAMNRRIRFLHVSTDAVYPGTRGNYSEKDVTIPYNTYGWTKLGAECAVHSLRNFCIMRMSFFDPGNIPFAESATDAYSSKLTVQEAAESIALMLGLDFAGTINIGGKRKSDFDHYRPFKPSLRPCTREDILKSVTLPLYTDSSMDTSLWEKTKATFSHADAGAKTEGKGKTP